MKSNARLVFGLEKRERRNATGKAAQAEGGWRRSGVSSVLIMFGSETLAETL